MERQISLIGKSTHRDGHFGLTFQTSGGEFSIPITAEEAKDFPDTVVIDEETGKSKTPDYDSIFTLTIGRPKGWVAPVVPEPANVPGPVAVPASPQAVHATPIPPPVKPVA